MGREDNRGSGRGGYVDKNSARSSYGKGNNKRKNKSKNVPAPKGNKRNNTRGGDGRKSSFASPEMTKAVYITAALPVLMVALVIGYFVNHYVAGS